MIFCGRARVLFCFLALMFCSGVGAEDSQVENNEAQMEMVVRNIKTPPYLLIQACERSGCENVELPEVLLDYFNDGYSDVFAEDLTLDGQPEIVLRHSEEGAVNICSKIYFYDRSKGSLRVIGGASRDMCNYYMLKGRFVSSYRSGAKWYEDIYRVVGDGFVLEMSDGCVGCGQVNRVVYGVGGVDGRFIVSDNLDYSLREPVFTRVVSDRAVLHEGPSLGKRTNMYLVKNDEVLLLDFILSDYDSEYWYQIKYVTAKGRQIKAWLACEDVEYCERVE